MEPRSSQSRLFFAACRSYFSYFHFASFFLFFFLLFRAVLEAYGGSQSRGGSVRAIATATQDPSCLCDLHHSSQQHQILNPLSEARDPTRSLMVPSQFCFCCATTGTPTHFLTLRFCLSEWLRRFL